MSKDPVSDSTDLYAFVSPDRPDTVTLIANYIPLQLPAGGPNFYSFGVDVLYQILIDNDGDGLPDISYEFRFNNVMNNPNTFLYNVGPITSISDPTWNRQQFYSVTRVDVASGASTVLARDLPCPPCNIGPLSTPNYADLATEAIHGLSDGVRVFAGQRAEGFYVDLGAIFDLGDLRPFEQLHAHYGLAVPELTKAAAGINATKAVNVHTIALQVPINLLTRNGSRPTSVTDSAAVIGVWTTASRQKVRMWAETRGEALNIGPFVQLSRLGNPLVNEVLMPMGDKDYWNTQAPVDDHRFLANYTQPELAHLLPGLYPNVFPHLAALNASGKPRDDLVAILLTGIPSGIVPGFQNYTGSVQADMLRLNVAIPPTASSKVSTLGLIGGDAAGFPNGRRVFDDVTTIELRALAGVTYALVDSSYSPDAAAGEVSDGLTSAPGDTTAMGTENYLGIFPYLGTPYAGFAVPDNNTPAMTASY